MGGMGGHRLACRMLERDGSCRHICLVPTRVVDAVGRDVSWALGFSDPASALGLSSVVMAGVGPVVHGMGGGWFETDTHRICLRGRTCPLVRLRAWPDWPFPIWIGSVLHLVLSWARYCDVVRLDDRNRCGALPRGLSIGRLAHVYSVCW